MSRFITANRIRCLSCGDVVESQHKHDYQRCMCGNVAAYGGKSHLYRNWPKGDAVKWFEELSEYHEEEMFDE